MEFEQNLTDFNIKPDDYYSLSRPEMLDFIPKNAKKILDVGCGYGFFGKSLKERFKAEVWGIELDSNAGEIAKKNIDQVFIGNVFEIIKTISEKMFDCIVFNDILEHLADPYSLLKSIKILMNQNGVIVCSIPNVRYIGNLKRLLFDKQWKYEDAGILDKTHLRFFTEKSIIDTMNKLDYEIIKIQGINPVKSSLFNIINIISLGNLSDTKFLQFAVVAKPK